MKLKNKMILLGLVLAAAIIALILLGLNKQDQAEDSVTAVKPAYGTIRNLVSTTGTVQPQNRLEIKPPISGRIEKILVSEGQLVRSGAILALMSSTERATLLDAARLKGKEEVAYWEKAYNATPLIAPINGQVIVRAVEPGQTVGADDAVIVLSDRLIVKAQVDETDIGGVKLGQKVLISLDAYPEIKVKGTVNHISYESEVVNNVTTYGVDIVPLSIPAVFRSGMSANVDIITLSKENILLIPLKAVVKVKGESYVWLQQADADNGRRLIRVQLGIAADDQVEVIAGLTVKDTVLIITQEYSTAKSEAANGSPLTPKFNRRNH